MSYGRGRSGEHKKPHTHTQTHPPTPAPPEVPGSCRAGPRHSIPTGGERTPSPCTPDRPRCGARLARENRQGPQKPPSTPRPNGGGRPRAQPPRRQSAGPAAPQQRQAAAGQLPPEPHPLPHQPPALTAPCPVRPPGRTPQAPSPPPAPLGRGRRGGLWDRSPAPPHCPQPHPARTTTPSTPRKAELRGGSRGGLHARLRLSLPTAVRTQPRGWKKRCFIRRSSNTAVRLEAPAPLLSPALHRVTEC